MSKVCRIISTFLIAAGLGFAFFYSYTQNIYSKSAVLDRPSYYILQNYWYVFLAGIIVLFFSLFGSFFSWLKEMEEKEEVLPNAGYVGKKDILSWLRGSSLDTEQIEEEKTEALTEAGQTEVLEKGGRTEILTEAGQTEVLKKGGRTEILREAVQTEIKEKNSRTTIIDKAQEGEIE